MSKHVPNKKQREAFDQVVKAIEKAQKSGLVFFGKQEVLVGYTKEADDYVRQNDFDKTLSTSFGVIPYLRAVVLMDSGADDYSCYMSEEDVEKFNPEGY